MNQIDDTGCLVAVIVMAVGLIAVVVVGIVAMAWHMTWRRDDDEDEKEF